jgi:hypothetical protein
MSGHRDSIVVKAAPKWNIIRQGHPDAEKQQRQSDMVSRYHHEDIQSEQAIYKTLQFKPPRAYIVQSLLLALEATFILYIATIQALSIAGCLMAWLGIHLPLWYLSLLSSLLSFP